MLNPSVDLTPAQWLATDGAFGGTVGDLLPDGFMAYLRIFHRPDQGLPGDGAAATWAEVAKHHGTFMHPEAQWTAIAGGNDQSLHRPEDPESSSDQPVTGSLDPLTLSQLACLLAENTTSPGTCYTALWNGTGTTPDRWHGFQRFDRQIRSYWLFPPVPVMEVPQLSVEFENLGIEEQAHSPGGLRGLMTFDREPTPADGVNWVRWSREQGFVQSPSYWWPQDHSWVVHTEVDYDSTLIAGSTGLAAALLGDSEIECLRVTRSTSLWSNADRINTP